MSPKNSFMRIKCFWVIMREIEDLFTFKSGGLREYGAGRPQLKKIFAAAILV